MRLVTIVSITCILFVAFMAGCVAAQKSMQGMDTHNEMAMEESSDIVPGELTIAHAMANESPPMAETGAAYLTILNGTDTGVRFLEVEADVSRAIELHETIDDSGIMRMVHQPEGFEIPAGQSLILEPGGRHIMFIGLNEPLKAGEEIELTLHFQDAEPIAITVPVVRIGGPGADHKHDMGSESAESAKDPAPVHAGEAHHHGDSMREEIILGEATVEGYQLRLATHEPLHTGYNTVMVEISDANGMPVERAEMAFQPVMAMVDGKSHAAGVEHPVEEMPGMYHGAIAFPMPSGPELGTWTVTASVEEPTTGFSNEVAFPVEVVPSKLSGSFVAPDESKLFLMMVEPVSPAVGAQPFEVFVMEKASMMEWPPVDDLTLEIEPWMPSMGHGSPNNENPEARGEGHYLGQANFTMAGPWIVTVVAKRGEEVLGEVVFDYNVP